MAWTPIVGRKMNLTELQTFIDTMEFSSWKPRGMVVHNTGVPSFKQWHQVSGETRMRNLENYFKNQRGWSSAPHAFVADDFVWPFTPFNRKGTHSPSWNGTHLGIEMVADFDKEDPYSGPTGAVYKNTVALFAMLHMKLGLDPDTIKLHREDPRTTHACPGKKFDKKRFIEDVQTWMNHGGDSRHTFDSSQEPFNPAPKRFVQTMTPSDSLNVRSGPGTAFKVIAVVPDGSKLPVFSSELNRNTKWLRVEANGKDGWISAQYTKEVV